MTDQRCQHERGAVGETGSIVDLGMPVARAAPSTSTTRRTPR